MHAIVCHEYGGPEVMQYEESPRPEPAASEVLIKAEAMGVNFVDTMRRSGKHPAAPEIPFTPGIEVCGRVAAIGRQAARFREGDRVIGRCVTHGAYAEYVCVEERFTVSRPDELSAEQGAALFVNGQTAYHALVTMGQTKPGMSVLITAAAGGVGVCAVQVAKRLGAHVIAAASTAEKRKLVTGLGADHVVDYTAADWPDQVLAATAGEGADLILESVGANIFSGCLRCWAPGGRLVIFGKASGKPAILSGDDLLFGNRAVCGLAVGTVIENEMLMRETMDQLMEWLQAGRLRLHIGQVYQLCDAAQAHRDLVDRKSTGKLILTP